MPLIIYHITAISMVYLQMSDSEQHVVCDLYLFLGDWEFNCAIKIVQRNGCMCVDTLLLILCNCGNDKKYF